MSTVSSERCPVRLIAVSMLTPFWRRRLVHGEDRGLRYAAVEVRQDLIDTHHGAESWANILADAVTHVADFGAT